MTLYIALKSAIMTLFLAGAFYLFKIKVKRLYPIMQSMDGKGPGLPDRIRQRMEVVFKDILGQSNVRRKKITGWAHTVILNLKTNLFQWSQPILDGNKDEIEPLAGKTSGITPDVLWVCTTCRAYEDINIWPR